MNIRVNAQEATDELKKRFDSLSNAEVNKSITRAINNTLGKVKTDIGREIRAKYRLSTSDVNANLKLEQAKNSRPWGYIEASVSPFSLSKFNPIEVKNGIQTKRTGGKNGSFKETKAQKNSREGVTIEIIAGQKETIQSAFLFRGKNGMSVKARGVYSRGFIFDSSSKSKTLKSVSVYSILKGDTVRTNIRRYIELEYPAKLEDELMKRINKIA
jgi:hypothetical protein